MATKYEYNDGTGAGKGVYDTFWMAQTFTPTVNHNVTTIKIKCARTGSPGTVTVSIRATSGGLPTGIDLVSGTFNGDTISEWNNYEWVSVTLGRAYKLLADTMYAIVVKAPAGSESPENVLYWQLSSDSYSGGTFCESDDSGSTWAEYASGANDCGFEEWGNPFHGSGFIWIEGKNFRFINEDGLEGFVPHTASVLTYDDDDLSVDAEPVAIF